MGLLRNSSFIAFNCKLCSFLRLLIVDLHPSQGLTVLVSLKIVIEARNYVQAEL